MTADGVVSRNRLGRAIWGVFDPDLDSARLEKSISRLRTYLPCPVYALRERGYSLTIRAEPERNIAPPRAGYVYLLEAENGLYKIGATRKIIQRREQFRREYPVPVRIRHVIQDPDMYGLETRLHKAYAEYRRGGEWFALTKDAVSEICLLGVG